jgi:hypothetical protein
MGVDPWTLLFSRSLAVVGLSIDSLAYSVAFSMPFRLYGRQLDEKYSPWNHVYSVYSDTYVVAQSPDDVRICV